MNCLQITVLAASVACSASLSLGQAILIDDFTDGNNDGWGVFNTTGLGGSQSIVDGRYVFATDSVVPARESSYVAIGSFWLNTYGPGAPFSNGTWRFDFVMDNLTSGGGLTFRDLAETAEVEGYSFGLDPTLQNLAISVVSMKGDQVHADPLIIVPLVIVAGQRYECQATAIGSHLSFKVWAASETEPMAPQIEIIDSTYSTGGCYIAMNNELNFASVLSGSFDNFYFTPPCLADFNLDTSVTSQDFFDFLTGFFAGSADINHDGDTTSQDFFDFLTAFFAGC